jgi:DNA-directed RNA polymerase subunit RPC12/RpoP
MRNFCFKCRRDTEWRTLVENSLGYQTQYHECSGCGDRIIYNKIRITREDEKTLKGKEY